MFECGKCGVSGHYLCPSCDPDLAAYPEFASLKARNAQLVEALTEAIYEVTHLSAPRPDDIKPVYRSMIDRHIVDKWRKALAASG